MSIFDSVSGKISGAIGGSGLGGLGESIASGAGTIGMGMLKSRLPAGLGPGLSMLSNVSGLLMDGDLKGAALGALNSGIFTSKFPWLDGAAAAAGFLMQPNRSMGGVTPVQAKRIMQSSLSTKFAHKNLFLVEIIKNKDSDIDGIVNSEVDGADFQKFNLFVTDISYSDVTINSQQHMAGSVALDQPISQSPTELKITTMDNEEGHIKLWFRALSEQVANTDGTNGVPVNYLVKIKILHSFINQSSKNFWKKESYVFTTENWYRPASVDYELSRKEDGNEEFTMVFHQFDPYHR